MRRPFALLLLACVALSACGKSAPENPAPAGEAAAGFALIDYAAPQGSFSCRAPADWGVEEAPRDGDNVTFVSRPLPACGGRLAFINFIRRPESPSDKTTDARAYAESFWEIDPGRQQPALEVRKIGGADVILFHQEQPYRKPHSKKLEYMLRQDHALVPDKGGFHHIRHSAPADCYQATLPVFEAVVASFKPKS